MNHNDQTTTHSASTSQNSNNRNLKGINIEDALSILSSRAKAGREKELVHNNQIHESMKQMGQTINLYPSEHANNVNNAINRNNVTPSSYNCGPIDRVDVADKDCVNESLALESKDEEEKRKEIEQERIKREEKIRMELSRMSMKELIGAILGVQTERVLAYKDFDVGLEQVLQSGNISSYPSACAKATASFSVLSSSINTMNEMLLTKQCKDRKKYYEWIRQLQAYEKEKLNLTAALHLEQIRKQNHSMEFGVDENITDDGIEEDDKILSMFNKGILSLKKQVSVCVENINEVLDDLRCELIDMEDE